MEYLLFLSLELYNAYPVADRLRARNRTMRAGCSPISNYSYEFYPISLETSSRTSETQTETNLLSAQTAKRQPGVFLRGD